MDEWLVSQWIAGEKSFQKIFQQIKNKQKAIVDGYDIASWS